MNGRTPTELRPFFVQADSTPPFFLCGRGFEARWFFPFADDASLCVEDAKRAQVLVVCSIHNTQQGRAQV